MGRAAACLVVPYEDPLRAVSSPESVSGLLEWVQARDPRPHSVSSHTYLKLYLNAEVRVISPNRYAYLWM